MQHELLKNNSASIDHLGIAVKSLQAAKSFYSILGSKSATRKSSSRSR